MLCTLPRYESRPGLAVANLLLLPRVPCQPARLSQQSLEPESPPHFLNRPHQHKPPASFRLSRRLAQNLRLQPLPPTRVTLLFRKLKSYTRPQHAIRMN